MFRSLKNPKVLIVIVVVISIAAVGFVYLSPQTKFDAGTYTVLPADLIEEVSATGTVTPAQSVDLAFDRSGRIGKVNAVVGDKVKTGQVLVVLENADLLASLNQAEASVIAASSTLDQLVKGASLEQIALDETNIANAEAVLDGAKASAVSQLGSAYTVADDAIRNKVDAFFNNPKSSNPTLAFTLSDSQLVNNINSQRFYIEGVLNDWKAYNGSLSTESDISAAILYGKDKVDKISSFLQEIGTAVNSLIQATSLSQSVIDGYKLNVSTARTNLSNAANSIISSNNAYNAAVQGLNAANEKMVLDKTGGTEDQIAAGRAVVAQAEASVQNLEAQIAKTIMRSPINGTVSRLDAKVGEVAAPAIPLASVISDSNFQIETYVSEDDISKIKVGNQADVSLDAYPNNTLLAASVIKIDPAETMVNGSAAYKITLQFDDVDPKIKSGLTANAVIVTSTKNGVLAVPEQAIVMRGNGKYVMTSNGSGEPTLINVVTGINGSNGLVEIVQGLKPGQKIISFVGTNSQTK